MKKFTKSFIASILVLAMSISLAGCGNSAAKEAGNELMDYIVNNKTSKIAKHFEDDRKSVQNESYTEDLIDDVLGDYDLEDLLEDADYELNNVEVDDDVADFEYTVTVDDEEYTFEFTLELDDEDWLFEDDADFLASYSQLLFTVLYDADREAKNDIKDFCDDNDIDLDELGEYYYERYHLKNYYDYDYDYDYDDIEDVVDEISQYLDY